MRLRYRIKNALQFIAFAFYPKTTLIACTVFFLLVIAALIAAMIIVPSDSAFYNVVFALTTGASGSFFVSIIVELSGNYRNNKLAWQELQEYYSIVIDYEGMKQVLLGHTASQRDEKKARDEFIDAIFKTGEIPEMTDEIMDELKDIAEDQPKDLIEATWEQLPKIIPVLRKTFEDKKAFLNDDEILAIRCILDDYDQIRHEVVELLMMSPVLYDTLNTPDEGFLNYPKTILDNIPAWLKKHLASNVGQNAMERFVDSVMSDQFAVSQFLNDYEISVKGLTNYHSSYDDDENVEDIDLQRDEAAEEDIKEDEDYDFYEPETPEEHRASVMESDKRLIEENRSFVSWHISNCCLNIAKSIDDLEKNILKKPYYGFHLKYDREAVKHNLDDPMTDISYQAEKKRMENVLKRQ